MTAAARLDLEADSQATDLVVAASDGSVVLYRDLLGGAFEARPLPGLLPCGRHPPAPGRRRRPRRLDRPAGGGPGGVDPAAQRPPGGVRADGDPRRWPSGRRDQGGGPVAAARPGRPRGRATWRSATRSEAGGHRPVLGPGPRPLRAVRSLPRLRVTPDRAAEPPAGRLASRADFDGDGRTDLAAVGSDGTVRAADQPHRDRPPRPPHRPDRGQEPAPRPRRRDRGQGGHAVPEEALRRRADRLRPGRPERGGHGPDHLAQRPDPERDPPAGRRLPPLRGGAAAVRLVPDDLHLERRRRSSSSPTSSASLRSERAPATAPTSPSTTTRASASRAARWPGGPTAATRSG